LPSQAVVVFRDFFPFIAGKLPRAAAWPWSALDAAPPPSLFARAAPMTAAAFADRLAANVGLSPDAARALGRAVVVGGLVRAAPPEAPERASFAAWAADVAHGLDGYHAPRGGAADVRCRRPGTAQTCFAEVWEAPLSQSYRFERMPWDRGIISARNLGLRHRELTSK